MTTKRGILKSTQGGSMTKIVFAAVLAAGLIAAPLPAFTQYAPTPAPAAAPDQTSAKTEKPASAGMDAMRERQKKCGAEWKEAKTAGKVEKGMTWPQFWSACNKRLKAAG
jgi:hypothetical protein